VLLREGETRVIAQKAKPTLKQRVEEFRRKLGLSAKANPQRRYASLYDKVYRPDVLREAWTRVSANGGGAGVDGVSIAWIREYGVERYLEELGTELSERRYRPGRIKRVYIPKPDGRQRPLGVPTVTDRVVQMAVKLLIEPLFEADFLDCSYGFRPARSQHQALRATDKYLYRGFRWVVDVDLRSYFDTIPHDRLLKLVERRVNDRMILRLIRDWLKAGIQFEGKVEYPELGSAQGGVLSPLLSNIYLHEVDKRWYRQKSNAQLVRYADDMLILCGTEEIAKREHDLLRDTLREMGLSLNEDKTRVVPAEAGFDFLGFSFRPGTYIRNGEPRTILIKVPRRKSLEKIRQGIKEAVKFLPLNEAVGPAVQAVNLRLKGWANYFRIGHAYEHLQAMVWHAEKQLRIFIRRKFQRKYSQGTRRTYPSNYLHSTLGLYTVEVLYAGK
jgi:RNA-directed DNA polymerase